MPVSQDRGSRSKGLVDRVLDRFVHNATSRSLTASWLFTLTLLMTALLGTWDFVPMVLSDFVLGILMFFGGVLMFFETIYEGTRNRIDTEPSDIAGLTTAVISVLYAVGLVSGSEFFATHFDGVQGSALLVLVIFLVWEGVGNRA